MHKSVPIAVFSCVLLALSFGVSAADVELRIAVNATTIESLPVFRAAELFPVRLVPVQNGRAAMAQLVDGSVDAATGSETQALLNSVAVPGIRIVLTLSECRYRIVGRRSSGIRRIADLKGKNVATTVNTSAHYYLSGLLRGGHLEDSDVRLTTLEGPDMPEALKTGTVDAVSIWEPHAQNAIDALGADYVVIEDPSVYRERFNLNSRAEVLSDPAKRRAMEGFVQAIVRASAELQNGTELRTRLAPSVGVTAKTLSAVWPQFRFPASVSKDLRSALFKVEPWVAEMQKRKPRPRDVLEGLIDGSLVARR